jgi:hypothetical protein
MYRQLQQETMSMLNGGNNHTMNELVLRLSNDNGKAFEEKICCQLGIHFYLRMPFTI